MAESLPAHIPVLTVRQPWAWAILHGGKTVENRSWEMTHRGPMWLHAGARSRWDPAGADSPLAREAWSRYLRDEVPGWPGLPSSDVTLGRRTTLMPFGAVTALLEVTDCHHDNECRMRREVTGQWSRCNPWAIRGQWHIEVRVLRTLPEPVPCRGNPGLWWLPDDAEKAARAQLEVACG